MYNFLKNTVVLLLCLAFFASCDDDSNPGMAQLQVKMIDAPADYDQVIIDVEDVMVKSEDEEWVSLNGVVNTRYDLLELTNGNSVFLGEVSLPEGRLNQIRLLLGDDNDVVIDGITHDLTVPSGSESGLKVNVHTDLEAGITYTLVLDFDAGKSVVEAGNSGKYNLKPVIRAEMEALTGAISGVISPVEASPVVYAISVSNDTVTSYPDVNGQFMIGALDAGIYTVVAEPSTESSFNTVSTEGVIVVTGEVTTIDTLEL